MNAAIGVKPSNCEIIFWMRLDLTLPNQLVERIEAEDQPWDSRVLGLRCARVTRMERLNPDGKELAPSQFYRPMVEAFAKQGWEYVIARRPAGEWRRYHLLENIGFRVLDQILGFRRPSGVLTPSRQAQVHVRKAQLSDEAAVADLSAKSFTRSRFHNDPLLTKEQCRRVYHEWGARSVQGQAAQGVWIAEIDHQPVGFITLKIQEEHEGRFGVIDLIGVLPEFCGRGIGQALVTRGLEWCSDQGIPQVVVQTQADNLAAIQLYVGMGFKPDYASVTLRWSACGG
jgi:ribosomal protein S18 acetylase RimI-like enzyme